MSCNDDQLDLFQFEDDHSTPSAQLQDLESDPVLRRGAATVKPARARKPPPTARAPGKPSSPVEGPPTGAPSSALPERYMTVKEVAAYYAVSVPTIWRWLKEPASGFPAPVHIAAGTTRWHRSDLLDFDLRLRAHSAKGGAK